MIETVKQIKELLKDANKAAITIFLLQYYKKHPDKINNRVHDVSN